MAIHQPVGTTVTGTFAALSFTGAVVCPWDGTTVSGTLTPPIGGGVGGGASALETLDLVCPGCGAHLLTTVQLVGTLTAILAVVGR